MYCKKCGSYIEKNGTICENCGWKDGETIKKSNDTISGLTKRNKQDNSVNVSKERSTNVSNENNFGKVIFCIGNLAVGAIIMALLLFSNFVGPNDASKSEIMKNLWNRYGSGYEAQYNADTTLWKTATNSVDYIKEINEKNNFIEERNKTFGEERNKTFGGARNQEKIEYTGFLLGTIMLWISIIVVIISFVYAVYKGVTDIGNVEDNILYSRVFGYSVMVACIVCFVWVLGFNSILEDINEKYVWQCSTMVYVIGFIAFIYASAIQQIYNFLYEKKSDNDLKS